MTEPFLDRSGRGLPQRRDAQRLEAPQLRQVLPPLHDHACPSLCVFRAREE